MKISHTSFMALLNKQCHVIEKGLSMKFPRPGFGVKMSNNLLENLSAYLSLYGVDQVSNMTYRTLKSYYEFNTKAGYDQSSQIWKLEEISKLLGNELNSSRKNGTISLSRREIIKSSQSKFEQFALGRHSIRNFNDKPVEIKKIRKAIEISLKAPTNCNTQSWRVYSYEGQKTCGDLLSLQNGNRGFGHLVKNLLVLTCDLKVYEGVEQRNLPYIDGGLYAMSLVYSLHHQGLGSCCLNLALSYDKEKKLRKMMKLSASEVFIMMIAVGNLPETLMVPESERKPINDIFFSK
jgi:nitroreductase